MPQFQAFDRSVEVNGQTVMSIVDGMPDVFEYKAREMLAENGIEDPRPNEWYPQQAWLDTFEDISEQIGDATLTQIGKSIPESMEWPPSVSTLEEGLEEINQTYHMNHRGGDIGYYQAARFGDDKVEVRCKNPYACAFDSGLIKATAKEFSDGRVPNVTETSHRCRADGGEECVYEVSWW